ncbi:type II CRISPR-associated endonuclease Cas1 [Azospirillum halopraeferens]|uniref:type II CRISPR-associated endonuclease Cas1 n=1 Tax=Azospirillum halopraeferens TaxID=34010 RepID=UPI0003F86ACF|nr:type II CRISPR-associated endonuclease Cas1 [Azospirillum halopraeferens]
MAWRAVHLSRPARLSLASGQMVVAQDDGDVRLALEDIACLVVDTPQASFTSALLSAFAEAGIALIVTDATHMPSGVLLPFHRHFRQGDVARRQVGLSAPLRKRFWQAIVQAKIANQAAVLAELGRGGAATLVAVAQQVRSGDPDNVEARAAREYWKHLWPEFRRDDEGDRRNKLLNYGYAVVRSAVARALVAAGFLPAFGLHHDSATNAFNLADDLVEPFRPVVDRLAWKLAPEGAPSRGDLTRNDRQAMAGAILEPVRFGDDEVTLLAATELTANALARAMDAKTAALLVLPSF